MGTLYWNRFPIKHSWLAVLFGPIKKAYMTHTDLLTLLFCMIWANLFISAFVNTPTDPFSIAQKVVNGIIVALFVFPITLIFSVLFYKMPRRYMWITYLLAGLFMVVSAILTLVETLKFGNDRTKTWLVSISIATLQDGVVNQPVKLIVTTIAIILFPAAPIIAVLL